MRLMGLDVGDRRIGIALSDPLGFTAQGHSTLERKSNDQVLETIGLLCDEYEVGTIVVGLPLNMNGSIGPRAQLVEEWAEQLSARLGREIVFWDERLTTVSAQRTLLEADLSRKKRKGLVDKIAAVYILQGFLDRQSQNKTVFDKSPG
ncbi:MAG: Holliday junction resolvase RuvX [Syntrophomonadaceae bacterium]